LFLPRRVGLVAEHLDLIVRLARPQRRGGRDLDLGSDVRPWPHIATKIA